MNPVSSFIRNRVPNPIGAALLDDVLFKGGVATLGTAAATGLGAEAYNAIASSDADINSGDLARAAMLLGALGYGGVRGLDKLLTGPMGFTRAPGFNMAQGVPNRGVTFGYMAPVPTPGA